jgi:membrane peptidoglycan carboxypeptidase
VGPDVHGIAEASAYHFGRAPEALRPDECAFLVAILPSPRRLAAAFANRRGTPLRVRRVLDALARADLRAGRHARRARRPLARLVPAVVGARERAIAKRAAS